MNKTKYEILQAALERIAHGHSVGQSEPMVLARNALADASNVVEYRISARTWYGRSGGEYKAELTRIDTGEKLIEITGSMWGSDAWATDIRNAMASHSKGLFPAHNGQHPTIYFREVCKVDYASQEVSLKRDL